ncbi:MAG TPA: D-alanine--D-alanine ligase A [Candidatus Veblenbacteria bacterium]|uniref:D-alanine--D-alanine ligase n=2 Tax=Candidatus Vebleniibacteriota TaxID=1817921 RepID=A0A1G2Q746_9BACT|nr:MAG: D-alanine--D-alanine ligase A [Candidatus Veblenbacteria bacterium RIFOXYC1_FULL_42_9]OHA57026.1 MAG: D-alanine--D-alanine ligase A [Candidatus Veblenbacteria bacterium RIFOXYD1_FULL_43_11]HBH17160.1 D-alanine--D-alanine ligase A [Candidatus Veblenbacteria bacterium]HBT92494.1 D-alanine--D-alanine ligase A [Candidatus Veblenbacteria bacterium]HCM45697.1 D-alanine--D-alanine ligase A [Candidatus Veblenbacteria bacterium]
MPRRKLKVGVLFGGRSAEHEVSLVSAESVMKNLDRKKYQVVPIGIDKQGQWMIGNQALKLLKAGKNFNLKSSQALLPEPGQRRVDVIFPLIHGTFGEDGKLQGFLELADVPYIGAGVSGSAVGMDKIVQKQIYQAAGISTPKFDYFPAPEFKKSAKYILRRLKKLNLPVFVKPANTGSSVGVSKVKQGRDLRPAIKLALKYDRRVIVEQAVPNPMEIEVAVLGNDKPKASILGQIVPSNEFYDYDAKYVDGKSKAIIPASLPVLIAKKIRALAVEAFKVLDLAGMARVDFLVSRKTWKIYLNEVNTIPGFVSISMYPKLWAASGLPFPKLLDELINLALSRHRQKQSLATSFRPKAKWYR